MQDGKCLVHWRASSLLAHQTRGQHFISARTICVAPAEYHSALVAESLGDVVGDIVIVNNDVIFSSTPHYLRVRVHVDPNKSLVQNIQVRLDDDSFVLVECKYECVFRSCSYCHVIGHSAQDCPWTVGDIYRGFQAISNKVSKLYGSRISCNFDDRHRETQWQ